MPDTPTVIEVGKKSIALIISSASQEKYPWCCFVLGHGASGDASTGNLPAIADRLSKAGITVVRYTCAGQLPARIKVLQAILDSDNVALSSFKTWILSGHSMGGRTACAVARDRKDVAGVVLFSFPLHPPGRESELRDKDLAALQVPVLIIRGTKDAFSKEAIFNEVTGRTQASHLQVHTVEGGDHSLGTKTQAGKVRFDEWIQTTEKFVNKVFSGAEKQLKTESNAKEEKPEGTAPKAASSAGPPDRRQTKRKAKASGDEKDKSHASKRQSNKKA